MLHELNKNRIDSVKPRREGLTYIVDRLQSFDRENFEILAPFIDVTKISVIPLLIPNAVLERKIKFYHNLDIQVSTGSSITEFAILENSFDKFVKESRKLGFDIIEMGENSSIQLDLEEKIRIAETILSNNINFQWKVGRKDPRHQLTVDETLSNIEEAIKTGSQKIVLESNEGLSAGIYDERGFIKWNFVAALTSKYPPPTFIFESPIESQQSSLIAEFGQRVNLAGIDPDSVATVESQRRGFLAKATFGVSYLRKDPEGGPASKFVYYIIKTKNPIDQSELISLSHLPRRTIQSAIDELKNQGLVIERNSLDDARKKVYMPVRSDWL